MNAPTPATTRPRRGFSRNRVTVCIPLEKNSKEHFQQEGKYSDRNATITSLIGFRLGKWTNNQDYVSVCASHLIMPQLSVEMKCDVRHALACRIARQTEVCRTFALKLHHHPILESVDILAFRDRAPRRLAK